jgi:hypothetical protein
MTAVSNERTVLLENCLLFENGVTIIYKLPSTLPPVPSLYSTLPFVKNKRVSFAQFTQEFPALDFLEEAELAVVELNQPVESCGITVYSSIEREDARVFPIAPVRSSSIGKFKKPKFLAL